MGYTRKLKPEFHEKNGKNSKRIIYQLIKEYGYENSPDLIYIQSFHPGSLQFIKSLKSNIPLIQLIGENDWGDSSTDFDQLKTTIGLKNINEYASGIGIWLKHIDKDNTIVNRAKNLGFWFMPILIARNHQKNNEILRRNGLDGIFTDIPKD